MNKIFSYTVAGLSLVANFSAPAFANAQSMCSANGTTLGMARAAYSRSCDLPRKDCDLNNGIWTCASHELQDGALPGTVEQHDTTTEICLDIDGDGWGWTGTESCSVGGFIATQGICVDSDGDGWGWDGVASCQVESATSVSGDVSAPDDLPSISGVWDDRSIAVDDRGGQFFDEKYLIVRADGSVIYYDYAGDLGGTTDTGEILNCYETSAEHQWYRQENNQYGITVNEEVYTLTLSGSNRLTISHTDDDVRYLDRTTLVESNLTPLCAVPTPTATGPVTEAEPAGTEPETESGEQTPQPPAAQQPAQEQSDQTIQEPTEQPVQEQSEESALQEFSLASIVGTWNISRSDQPNNFNIAFVNVDGSYETWRMLTDYRGIAGEALATQLSFSDEELMAAGWTRETIDELRTRNCWTKSDSGRLVHNDADNFIVLDENGTQRGSSVGWQERVNWPIESFENTERYPRCDAG